MKQVINKELLGVSIGETTMGTMRALMESLGYRDQDSGYAACFRDVLYGGIVWERVRIKSRKIIDTVGEIWFEQDYTENPTFFNSLATMLTQKYGQLVTKQTETEIELTDGSIMVSLYIHKYTTAKSIILKYSLIERRYIDSEAF